MISPGAYDRLHINQTYNPPGYYGTGLGGRVNISAFALGEDDFATHRVFIVNSTNTAYLGVTGK